MACRIDDVYVLEIKMAILVMMQVGEIGPDE